MALARHPSQGGRHKDRVQRIRISPEDRGMKGFKSTKVNIMYARQICMHFETC